MGGIYLKIYRADIIKNNNLKFRENLAFGEDYIFNLEYFNLIETYCIIPEVLYNYNIYPKLVQAIELLRDERIENERIILELTQKYIKKNELYLSYTVLLAESLRIINGFLSIIINDNHLKIFEKYKLFAMFMNKLNVKALMQQSRFPKNLSLKYKVALWFLRNNYYLCLMMNKYLR